MTHINANDWSFGITVGINNLGFWRPKFGLCKKKHGIFLFAGWLTIILSRPTMYHFNAFYAQKIAELTRALDVLAEIVEQESPTLRGCPALINEPCPFSCTDEHCRSDKWAGSLDTARCWKQWALNDAAEYIKNGDNNGNNR